MESSPHGSPLDRLVGRFADGVRASIGAGPRVWAIVAAIAAAGTATTIAVWDRMPPELVPQMGIFGLLALGFILVESFPVHLQFRSETASFSMIEIPIVVALFMAEGRILIAAIGTGTLIALWLVRRQPFVKLVFNVSNLILQAGIATLLFELWRNGDNPLEVSVSLAAFAATGLSSVLNVSLLSTVIAASEGEVDRRRFVNTVLVAVVVGVTNTSIGLIAVVLINAASWALLLLGIPLAVLFVSYRAFVSERTQREQVEFLYSATKSLQASDEREVAVETLVREAASMFRASKVQILLFGTSDSSTSPLQCSLSENEIDVQSDHDPHLELATAVAGELRDAQLVTISETGAGRDLLDDWGITEGMVTALVADEEIIGLLTVADRVGTVGGFGSEDLRLFETLAYHASAALENDRLGQALSQLQTLEQELSHLATHDTLTGLPNRLQLRQRLDQLAQRNAAEVELMFIDLDDFKFVNDTYGHAAGDELLREMAERLRGCMRSSDIAARLGGDEFAIVVQPAGAAQAIADRIIDAVSQPVELDANTVTVGCSVGIARSKQGQSNGAHLLRQADIAMYAAKSAGKGRVAYYSPELGRQLAEQRRLQQRMRAAMASDELCVHYQPIFDLHDEQMVGAEALVRWNSPDGLQPAEAFLSVVEEGGFVAQLDRWVLVSALKDLREIESAGLWHSVNLSARSLHDDDIVAFIVNAAADAGVDPTLLVIEVTETAAMRDVEATAAKLERLAAAGFKIALDDFGTGFSSINHLRQLPVDLLKIAQPFVADVGVSQGETFIKAMIDLGQTLGLEVVAEGIETHPQLIELGTLGCEYGQGFLLGRPMSAADLRQRVAELHSAGAHDEVASTDLASA